MKISVIVFSETGTTQTVADAVISGLEEIKETEVKCFNIAQEDTWDTDFITESQAVIFGTPTYYANLCWQMKKWFDTRGVKYNLAGKLGSAFATENNPYGGGGGLAIMTVDNHLLVYGMLVYSSGVNYGRPPIHIGPTISRDRLAECDAVCKRFGNHIARKAHELFD